MTSAPAWVRLSGDLDGMIVIADALARAVKRVARVLRAAIRTLLCKVLNSFRRLFEGPAT